MGVSDYINEQLKKAQKNAEEARNKRIASEQNLSRTNAQWDSYFSSIKAQFEAAGWSKGYFTPKLVELFKKLDKMIPPLGLDVNRIKKAREEEAQLLKEKYKKDKKSYDDKVVAATNSGFKPGDENWKKHVGEPPNDILAKNVDSILEAEKTWGQRNAAYKQRLTDAAKKGIIDGSEEWFKFVGPKPKKYQTFSIVNGGVETKDIEGAAQAVEQLGSEPLSYDEAARKIGLGILTEDTDIFEDLDKLLDNLDVQFGVSEFIKDIGEDLDKIADEIETAIRTKIAAFEDNIKIMLQTIKDYVTAYFNDQMVWIKNWIMAQLPKYPLDMLKYAGVIAVKQVYNDIKAIKGIIEIVLERTQEYILFVAYLTEALIKKFTRALERVDERVNKITEQAERNLKLFGDEINNTLENAKGIARAAGEYQKRLIGLKEEAIKAFTEAGKSIA